MAKCIYATSEELRIRHHHYHDVLLGDFIRGAGRAASARRRERPARRAPMATARRSSSGPTAPITITRLIARLNESLDANTIVISDVGDALFAATELTTHARTEFIGPAYYTSMGFARARRRWARGVARPGPADRGAGGRRRVPDDRQRTVDASCGTASTTIVIVLDNKGYGTERFLHPGEFNEIHPWNYAKMHRGLLGGGTGYEVRTEGEFDQALAKAWADTADEPDPGPLGPQRHQPGARAAGGTFEQAGVTWGGFQPAKSLHSAGLETCPHVRCKGVAEFVRIPNRGQRESELLRVPLPAS